MFQNSIFYERADENALIWQLVGTRKTKNELVTTILDSFNWQTIEQSKAGVGIVGLLRPGAQCIRGILGAEAQQTTGEILGLEPGPKYVGSETTFMCLLTPPYLADEKNLFALILRPPFQLTHEPYSLGLLLLFLFTLVLEVKFQYHDLKVIFKPYRESSQIYNISFLLTQFYCIQKSYIKSLYCK